MMYGQPSLQRLCLSPNNLMLNCISVEMNSNSSWHICANTIDVVKNFAGIKNVAIKRFLCISFPENCFYLGKKYRP